MSCAFLYFVFYSLDTPPSGKVSQTGDFPFAPEFPLLVPEDVYKRQIPSYQALVTEITNALEEKDREEFTRLKVIKRSAGK